MKRVFITGISGFAGSHLAEMLLAEGDFEIFGTVFGDGYRVAKIPENNFIQLNLMDRDKTLATIAEIKPNWIFHLAALSSPAQSFNDPRETITNNIEGQINVMDGLIGQKQVEKILIIGSAEEYGSVPEENIPIKESQELKPLSPYAVSKVAQDYLGLQYFLHHKLPVVRVRPFNHTGERQAPLFVVSAFAKQIADIESGQQEPILYVGNLEAVRDFTDVKDMMSAYRLAMETGILGEVYNLGSGQGHRIREVLDLLVAMARVPITIKNDPERTQPSDIPQLICDATKFNKLNDWEPKITFGETLKRVLDYWRNQTTT